MTVLAEFQVYDTDNQPWAWFTMPMILWVFAVLAAGMGLLMAAVVGLIGRTNRVDLELAALRKQLAARPTAEQHAALRDYAGTTRAQLNALLAWAHAVQAEQDSDAEPPTDDFARDLIGAAFTEPAPRGRHAAPDQQPTAP